MDKKFLSAEEAASQFGIELADFQRLVDARKLRALADRGSWKYRRDEIVDLIQNGLLAAQHPQGDVDAPQTLEFPRSADQGSREDLAFLEIDEQALEEGATQITPNSDFAFLDDEMNPKSGFASDSEILMIESDADVPVSSSSPTPPSSEMPVAGSLSEFNLVLDDNPKSAADSPRADESSVIIGGENDSKIDSDSDVKVVASKGGGSSSELGIPFEKTSKTDADAPRTDESSVIIGGEGDSKIDSDSDVKVIQATEQSSIIASGSGADHAMLGDSSVISPLDKSSIISSSDSDVRIADSGISLERVDSGITMDSGINLNADSGLSLETGDSGIRLEPDSGLTFESSAVDSGLSLEDADSGLSLSDLDSGIALSGKAPVGRSPRPDDTQAEFEQIDSDSSEHTGLIESFDDDSASLPAAPVAKAKKKAKSPSLSDSFDSVDEVEDLEIVDDLESGGLDVDDEEAADFEDEDILEASDEAFSIAEEGELSEESIASVPVMKSVVKEPSWGVATVIPIAACAFLLLVQGLILWDGISTMWNGDTSKAIGASIISALGGMI